jgi:hypothetical protein
MELVPKAEFSIVIRASKAWIPELIAAADPEVTKISEPRLPIGLTQYYNGENTCY